MPHSDLGKYLRGCRLRHGRRQVDIAEECGVDQVTVSGWESNKHRPRLQILGIVAQAYHASLNTIFRLAQP